LEDDRGFGDREDVSSGSFATFGSLDLHLFELNFLIVIVFGNYVVAGFVIGLGCDGKTKDGNDSEK